MSKPNIICVDDEMIILHSLKEQLNEEFGDRFKINMCQSAKEAIYLLEELFSKGEEVHVVISDYIMPEIRGDDLLKKIHLIDKNIVLILLTGQSTLHGIRNAVNNAHIFKFIKKPWSKEILYSYIKESLDCYEKNKLPDYNFNLQQLNSELKATVSNTEQELLKSQKELIDINKIYSINKEIEVLGKEITHSLESIRFGLDAMHDEYNRVSENNNQSISLYISNVKKIYKTATDTINNLVNTFEQNVINYFIGPDQNDILELLYKLTLAKVKSSEDVFRPVLHKLLEAESNRMEKVVAWNEEEILLFNIGEILFFLADGRNTFVVTKAGKSRVKDTLDKLEERYCKNNFFRCHRGYLINLNCISKIIPWIGSNNFITKIQDCPHEIPISKSKIKEMKHLLGFK